MHVLFLAPDTHVYNHAFLRGLRSVGAKISGIGPTPADKLSQGAKQHLDGYRACPNVLDTNELLVRARELAARTTFDRIETIDEPLIEPAARLREALGVPGLSVATARLCRDKVAMKEFLRERGIPCAASAGVTSAAELRDFAAREGYPLIVKPVDGFNSLDTFRVASAADLEALLPTLKLDGAKRVAVEEFIEGHEGFYDTIIGPDGIGPDGIGPDGIGPDGIGPDGIGPDGLRHDFVGHYYPGCLEANRTRWISPQIVVSNRIDGPGYRELREVGAEVAKALGLSGTATHMEWFFGPKGLKFGEIGARPAGEKIWDMYRAANDFDVFREWALAIFGRPSEARPSRRLSAGSIQVRPDKDGVFAGHTGVREVLERYGARIYEHELPPRGTPTKALDRGWLCNTWFRLTHEDYDELRNALTFIGETVKARTQ